MKFLIGHSIKENLRRKCYFIVCLFACFLVSLVCLISKTVVSQGSLIFLMLGERENGEMDIILKPNYEPRRARKYFPSDFYTDYYFINNTKFFEIMKNFEGKDNPYNTSTIRTYFLASSVKIISPIQIYLINTSREKDIDLGRNYPYDSLGKDECLIHSNLKDAVENKKLKMILNAEYFLFNNLLINYYENDETYNPNITQLRKIPFRIPYECKVKDMFNNNYGKLNEDTNNVIFMEMEYFYQTFSKFIPKQITDLFPNYKQIVYNTNPNDYGTILIVNFPKSRVNAYIESDFNKLKYKAVTYANILTKAINNIKHLTVNMPLITGMERFNYGSVLLNLILNVIIISLFSLSLILIYSLLVITTETNSFEFGVLRLIGNTKRNIILLVIFQCITFSIPGFILAFLLHFKILNLINYTIQSLVHTNLILEFSYEGFFLAIFVNFLSPITASILPIRSILKKNIATSLNSMLNKTSGMKIEIISVEKKELKTLIILGLMTFLYGIAIYYFLPLSLISLNFGMLGSIFLWILFGILLGFVILSINIENLLQKIVTHILLFFTGSYTKILIIKNLTAHRIKNRKTSIMYSLSIGVFIMINVGLDLIIQSAEKDIIMRRGSEAVILPSSEYFNGYKIKNSLKQMIDNNYIEYFSLKSPTSSVLCFKSDTSVENYGRSLDFKIYTKSISPLYFNANEKSILKIAQQNDNYKNYNPSEQLYFKEFRDKIGLSAIFTWEFNASLTTNFFLKISNTKGDMKFILKPAFLLNSAPGLQMNAVPSMMIQRTSITSFPIFLDIINKCNKYYPDSFEESNIYSYLDFPIEQINLKLNSSMDINKVIDGIKDIFSDDDFYVELWFFNQMKDNIDRIKNLVHTIFYVVCTIVLFFCFFNLTASMTINIFEQKKEIAIMRSLGMKKSDLIFIYICEAIVLILSSSIIGTIIGSLISYTMSLQWQMFTNVNVSFYINKSNLIYIIIFSIIGGIFSTIIPASNMLRSSIAALVKEI